LIKELYTIFTLTLKSKLNGELCREDRDNYFEAVFTYNLNAPFFMPHISINWDI